MINVMYTVKILYVKVEVFLLMWRNCDLCAAKLEEKEAPAVRSTVLWLHLKPDLKKIASFSPFCAEIFTQRRVKVLLQGSHHETSSSQGWRGAQHGQNLCWKFCCVSSKGVPSSLPHQTPLSTGTCDYSASS